MKRPAALLCGLLCVPLSVLLSVLLFTFACSRAKSPAPDPGIPERKVPVVAPGAPATTDPAAAENRPNVLLVIFDDLNDWIGPLDGYPTVKTPQLDRLARRGLVFTNAHADAPACNPSRTALLSGLRPSTSGVYFNGQPYLSALPGTYTLVEYFAAQGYRTLSSGKIFHSFGSGKQVWDERFDQKPDREMEAHNKDNLFGQEHFNWGPVDQKLGKMPDIRIARAAAQWLSEPSEKPFFLAVGFQRPHLPWNVPRRFFEEYPLDQISLPPGFVAGDLADVPPLGRRMAHRKEHQRIAEADAWKEAIQAYLASITFSDTALGIVLKALNNGPNKSNTIVVATSDHGFHLGEKNHWGKFTLWRPATRIPLIIAAPGQPSAGQSTNRPTTLVDLYPTLLELCGLPAPQNVDGISLAPLLEDPTLPWPYPAITTHRRGNTAMRTEGWTLIRYRDGTKELYNTHLDPAEWLNLAGDEDAQARIEELSKALPTLYAPNAPFVFKPYDIKATTRNLLRFFPAHKLKREIDRQALRKEQRRSERSRQEQQP